MDTYVVTEHEVGKPFDPPDELAQVVRSCGNFERVYQTTSGVSFTVRFVLVMWAYPKREPPTIEELIRRR